MSGNKQNVRCYYCLKPANSREHVPAKTLLDGHSGLNLITVSSCNEHNAQKANLDELIGLILIKPTLPRYRIFTPNPNKSQLRNLVTEMRIKEIYSSNLYKSNRFEFRNGVVSVTSETLLKEILDYCKMLLAGIFFHYTKEDQCLFEHKANCIFLGIMHLVDTPPTVFSSPENYQDYNILKQFRQNSVELENIYQHIKFSYEIRRFTISINLRIDNDDINLDIGDLLIIGIIHSNINIVGIFSNKNKRFLSLHKIERIKLIEYQKIYLP